MDSFLFYFILFYFIYFIYSILFYNFILLLVKYNEYYVFPGGKVAEAWH
jgi:hypothetical protein